MLKPYVRTKGMSGPNHTGERDVGSARRVCIGFTFTEMGSLIKTKGNSARDLLLFMSEYR